MPPEPIIPTTAASSRARYFAPRPAHPPTRMCCSTPSLMMASGSPLRVLHRKIKPQKVPGSTQYFSSVTPSGQVIMSDFMRIANTPSDREAPSIVPQR